MSQQIGKVATEATMPCIQDSRWMKGHGDVAFPYSKAKAGMKTEPPASRVSALAAGVRNHLLSS